MKVNNISAANNFGKINLCSDLYKSLSKNPEIENLTRSLVRGKNANITGNNTDGFFMKTADDSKIFLGKKPSVQSILKIVEGLNSRR